MNARQQPACYREIGHCRAWHVAHVNRDTAEVQTCEAMVSTSIAAEALR